MKPFSIGDEEEGQPVYICRGLKKSGPSFGLGSSTSAKRAGNGYHGGHFAGIMF